jgi:hypothetical protein
MIKKDMLIRLIYYGSPVAKAAALTLLNEKTGGELIKKLWELSKKFVKDGDDKNEKRLKS